MMVVKNPMGFHCAPNQCTPDYVSYGDFENFVAFGLYYCAFDQEHCSFPITDSFVYCMREGFLTTLRYMIFKYWEGEFSEDGEENIDMPSNGNIISIRAETDPENDDEHYAWYPFRVESKGEDASLAIELSSSADGQDTVLWLKLSAIEDKAYVRAILKMADAAVGPNQVECHYFTEGKGKDIPDLLTQFEEYKKTKEWKRRLKYDQTFSYWNDRIRFKTPA